MVQAGKRAPPRWRGEKLEAQQGKVLCASSTQIRCLLQETGFWATWQRNMVSNYVFSSLVLPLVWGCQPEKRLTVAPSREQNAFWNRDTNWGPRSDTRVLGNPSRPNTGMEHCWSCVMINKAGTKRPLWQRWFHFKR